MYQALTEFTLLIEKMEIEQLASIDLAAQRMYDFYQTKKFEEDPEDEQNQIIEFKVSIQEFKGLTERIDGQTLSDFEEGLRLFIDNHYAVMNADGSEIYLSPKGLLLMKDIWTRASRMMDRIS